MKLRQKILLGTLLFVGSVFVVSCKNNDTSQGSSSSSALETYFPDKLVYDGNYVTYEIPEGKSTYCKMEYGDKITLSRSQNAKLLFDGTGLPSEGEITVKIHSYKDDFDENKDAEYDTKEYTIHYINSFDPNDLIYDGQYLIIPENEYIKSYTVFNWSNKKDTVYDSNKIELYFGAISCEFKPNRDTIPDDILALSTRLSISIGFNVSNVSYQDDTNLITWGTGGSSSFERNYTVSITDGDEKIEEQVINSSSLEYSPKNDNFSVQVELNPFTYKSDYENYFVPRSISSSTFTCVTGTDFDITNNSSTIDIHKNDELEDIGYLCYLKNGEEIVQTQNIKSLYYPKFYIKEENLNKVYTLQIVPYTTKKNYYIPTKEIMELDILVIDSPVFEVKNYDTSIIYNISDSSSLSAGIKYLKINDGEESLIEQNTFTDNKVRFEDEFSYGEKFGVKFVLEYDLENVLLPTNSVISRTVDVGLKPQINTWMRSDDYYEFDFDYHEGMTYEVLVGFYSMSKNVSKGHINYFVDGLNERYFKDKDSYKLTLARESLLNDEYYYPRLESSVTLYREENPEVVVNETNLIIPEGEKFTIREYSSGKKYDKCHIQDSWTLPKASKYYTGSTINLIKEASKPFYIDSFEVPVVFSVIDLQVKEFEQDALTFYNRNGFDYINLIYNDEKHKVEGNSLNFNDYLAHGDGNFQIYLSSKVTHPEPNQYGEYYVYLNSLVKDYQYKHVDSVDSATLDNENKVFNLNNQETFNIWYDYNITLGDEIIVSKYVYNTTNELPDLEPGEYVLSYEIKSRLIDGIFYIADGTVCQKTFYKNGVMNFSKSTEYKVTFIDEVQSLDIFNIGYYFNKTKVDSKPNITGVRDGTYDLIVKDETPIASLNENYVIPFDDYQTTQEVRTLNVAYCSGIPDTSDFICGETPIYQNKVRFTFLDEITNEKVICVNYHQQLGAVDNTFSEEYDILFDEESNSYYFDMLFNYGVFYDFSVRFLGNCLYENGVYYYQTNTMTAYTKLNGQTKRYVTFAPVVTNIKIELTKSNSTQGIHYYFTLATLNDSGEYPDKPFVGSYSVNGSEKIDLNSCGDNNLNQPYGYRYGGTFEIGDTVTIKGYVKREYNGSKAGVYFGNIPFKRWIILTFTVTSYTMTLNYIIG